MIVALAGSYRAVMATGAAAQHRYIGVELRRSPTTVALVTSRAVGRGADVTAVTCCGRTGVTSMEVIGDACW